MSSKVILRSLWLGNDLSRMEELSISSFLYHGHEFHLYTYNEINVPDGTILRDANDIIPKDQVFKDDIESYVCFSDLFRYKLLLKKGGYWVDTDIVCLRNFDFESDYVFSGERTENGSNERKAYGSSWSNGCVTKVPIESKLMNFCYETSKVMKSKTHKLDGWELGPPILSEAVNKFKLKNYVLSYKKFNPVDWWDWREIISDKLRVRIKLKLKLLGNVYGIHLWSSMWKREGADKNGLYHPKCLYETLKAKYL